jgi:hypothetical protein
MAIHADIRLQQLSITIAPSAVSSWIKTTHRLIKTHRRFLQHRANVHHGTNINYYKSLHSYLLESIEDPITEFEADTLLDITASSHEQPRWQEPSPSSPLGCSVYTKEQIPLTPPGDASHAKSCQAALTISGENRG